MDLTRLRIWQWMAIGVLAGALAGFAFINRSNDLDSTSDARQFQRLVQSAANASKQKQPSPIRNIVVHQPELDPSKVLVYPVQFEFAAFPTARDRARQAIERIRQAAAGVKPAAPVQDAPPKFTSSGIYATTPFVGNDSVVDYLTKSGVPFTNRTGAGQYVPMYYAAGAGFVAIGLVWPGVIRLLVAAGLATPRPEQAARPKVKHRTGEDVDEMVTKPAAKTVDAGALDKLNDQMEAHLAATLESSGPRAPKVEAAEPVSVLMSGTGSRSTSDPTDRVLPPPADEEKKDYGGEYYPVARVIKKDDGTKAGEEK